MNFLKQMNIEVSVQKANSFSIPRISQLTLKTNQFNLTTSVIKKKKFQNFHHQMIKLLNVFK